MYKCIECNIREMRAESFMRLTIWNEIMGKGYTSKYYRGKQVIETKWV